MFYIAMSWATRHEAGRSGLPSAAHNSIKHAYASAEAYAWLRLAGIGPDTAAEWILRLGLLNEWVEARLKWRPDTPAELYKDLRNNMIGIAALRSYEKCRGLGSPNTRLRLIGNLASERALLWSTEDSRIPSLPHGLDVRAAKARLAIDRMAIEREAEIAVRELSNCGSNERTAYDLG